MPIKTMFFDMAFDSFTRAFNQLSDNSCVPLDRRLFKRVFIIYTLIEFQLFMGSGQSFLNQTSACLPRSIYSDIEIFITIKYLFNFDHHIIHFILVNQNHKVGMMMSYVLLQLYAMVI